MFYWRQPQWNILDFSVTWKSERIVPKHNKFLNSRESYAITYFFERFWWSVSLNYIETIKKYYFKCPLYNPYGKYEQTIRRSEICCRRKGVNVFVGVEKPFFSLPKAYEWAWCNIRSRFQLIAFALRKSLHGTYYCSQTRKVTGSRDEDVCEYCAIGIYINVLVWEIAPVHFSH